MRTAVEEDPDKPRLDPDDVLQEALEHYRKLKDWKNAVEVANLLMPWRHRRLPPLRDPEDPEAANRQLIILVLGGSLRLEDL